MVWVLIKQVTGSGMVWVLIKQVTGSGMVWVLIKMLSNHHILCNIYFCGCCVSAEQNLQI